MREPGAAVTNRLLDWLSKKDRARMISGCVRVDLSYGDVVSGPGHAVRDVYFPTGSAISVGIPMDSRVALEVGLAGNEGMYGVPLALGIRASPLRAVVQHAGSAWQIGAADFRRELVAIPGLRVCLDRYTYVFMAQLTQAAGCHRFHQVEQRLARWLLMMGDRAHAATFRITHQHLAGMLGVRRVGVTEAAHALQGRGLIRYTRGTLTILDREALERTACACYRLDIETYDRAFT